DALPICRLLRRRRRGAPGAARGPTTCQAGVAQGEEGERPPAHAAAAQPKERAEESPMRLVVRARPAPTESLMGFVLRLTELNGYPSTSYVIAAMGKEWYLPNVGRLDAARLATLAGLGQPDIERLTHRPAERPRAYVRVYGSDLPSYEVNL